MSADDNSEVTQILSQLSGGDPQAADRLLPLVYEELRQMAGRHFRRQPSDHTLQPTALVHEAFMKLVRTSDPRWENRTHFFAVAAKAMRQVLVRHAVAQNAVKRGGGRQRIALDEAVAASNEREFDVLALDEVLKRLEAIDERKHRMVELRFFAGLSMDEIATLLDVSKSTVENDWRAARAWLSVELREFQ
jgi:RNA polymerase sigma factor (TIGR02999 family)